MANIALDGHAHGSGTGTTVSASLTTVGTADYIYAIVAWKDTGSAYISSVASTHFTGKANGSLMTDGHGYKMQTFVGTATAALSPESITATFNTAPSGHIILEVFGARYQGNTQVSNPWAVPQAGTFAATSVQFKTDYSEEFVLGALMLAPITTITHGTGFTEIENVSATDFTLETEYQVVASKTTLNIAWTETNQAYTNGLAMADCLLGGTSLIDPYVVESVGAVVQQGVSSTWGMPVISVSGNTTIYDQSAGASHTEIITLNAETNPASTSTTENKFDGTTTQAFT
jgi:hypothetical protein